MDELNVTKSGLKTAVDELHDPNDRVPDTMDGEQLDLLPIRSVHKQDGQTVGKDIAPRGVGRPPGSKNKNTKEWRDYLLARYPSPLIAMAEIMSRPTAELASQLGFVTKDGKSTATAGDLMDCLKIQLSCAKELMPYLHQKQPQALDVGEGGLMTLNIFSAKADEVQNAEDFTLEIIDGESEQNQGVTAEQNEKLTTNELTTSQETAENQGIEGENPTD